MSLDKIYESYTISKDRISLLALLPLHFPFHSNGMVGVGRETDAHPWMPAIKMHRDLTQWQLHAGREVTHTLQSPRASFTLARLRLSSIT